MQNPVRFYITQSDDQAVVRAIPAPQRVIVEPQPQPEVAAASTKPAERLKVARLVRSAVKRGGSGT